MIKLPKAAIETTAFSRDSSTQSYYTEAQLKQAVRDALEEAAKRCKAEAEGRGDEDAFMATLCEERIRALIKEIPE